MARVLGIFICADAGSPMTSVNQVEAIKDKGLKGDRYAEGKGTFSRVKEAVVAVLKRPKIRHVSLIESEAIVDANKTVKVPFTWEETRRGIVTERIFLNHLVGKAFQIGEARMWGFELCDLCGRPSKLAEKIGFKEAFHNRGGLRVAVVAGGIITVGSEIATLMIHGLYAGHPLCGLTSEVPRDWPKNHWQVGLEEAAYITCPECLAEARKRR